MTVTTLERKNIFRCLHFRKLEFIKNIVGVMAADREAWNLSTESSHLDAQPWGRQSSLGTHYIFKLLNNQFNYLRTTLELSRDFTWKNYCNNNDQFWTIY